MDWKSGYGYGYGRVQYKDIISSRMISDKNSTLNTSSYPCSLISPNNLNCRMWNTLQPLAIELVEDPDHARVHLVQDQPLVLLPVLHTQNHPDSVCATNPQHMPVLLGQSRRIYKAKRILLHWIIYGSPNIDNSIMSIILQPFLCSFIPQHVPHPLLS